VVERPKFVSPYYSDTRKFFGVMFMGMGRLILQVVAADGAVLIQDASVILSDENNVVLYEFTTDETGHVPEVELAAPPIELTEDPYATERRYAVYDAQVSAEGYRPVIYKGIMIFDQSTSIQVVNMHPLTENEVRDVEIVEIGYHALDDPVEPEQQPADAFISPRILREVVIPNNIVVHLGRPENPAANVRVPFIDYVKNVASHEIFDTWPEQAIIANVYCIVSLALNRIFTEFYRKRGFAFDITNHTSIDHG